jgi:nucleotide-binding universal stress UspA family protein
MAVMSDRLPGENGSMLTLLLPVDGSGPSDRAVKHVVQLASSGMDARVLLLHVQPTARRLPDRQQRRAGMLQRLERSSRVLNGATSVLERAAVPCKRFLRSGSPGDCILEFARDQECDAIVMGTRGLGAVAGLVLGSVAMKVVQLARIPVTLVR